VVIVAALAVGLARVGGEANRRSLAKPDATSTTSSAPPASGKPGRFLNDDPRHCAQPSRFSITANV